MRHFQSARPHDDHHRRRLTQRLQARHHRLLHRHRGDHDHCRHHHDARQVANRHHRRAHRADALLRRHVQPLHGAALRDPPWGSDNSQDEFR